MANLPQRSASSGSDGTASDSANSGQANGVTSKSEPRRSDENAPVPHRTRRILLGLAALLALVTLGAFALALKQPVQGWGPAPSILSLNGFVAPREINRWQRTDGVLERPTLQEAAFSRDGRSALAVGVAGTVLRSDDGGQRWSEVANASKEWLSSVAFAPDGRSALAVGVGRVLRSDDGGQHWSEVARASEEWLKSVAFAPDSRNALAVGLAGTVLRSDDGGQRWSEVASASKASLDSVAFAPDGGALAVGEAGTVLRSDDFGQHWSEVATGARKEWLNSVAFAPDGRSALAVDRAGRVLRSDDGGQRWSEVASARKASLNSVTFAPDSRSALAVGFAGIVLRSDDGGQRWSEVASTNKESLVSVVFAPDGLSALAVGLRGTVLRSDDGGQRWTRTALYQRQPAPWFWALMLIVTSASLGFAFRYVSSLSATSTRRGLLDNGVSDSPITNAEQDRLLFNPVVEALSRFLRHAATRPPLAIAVNAAWGMGKSSFMKMLASQLKSMGARPVWFNIWHHQHEEVLLAPLLQAITQQAIPGLGQWEGWTFRCRLLRERWRRPDWAVFSGTAALLSVPGYLIWLAYRSDGTGDFWLQRMADRCIHDLHFLFYTLTGGQWIATAKGGGFGDVVAAAIMALREDAANGWLILLMAGLILCWVMLVRFLMRPFPARPSVLLASLNSRFSLSRAEAQTDFRQRFRRHFGDVTRALAPRTMTIFIDDLDRCKPEKAAELLESINYLADAGHCFVVLGVARDIVEAQVASAQKTLAEEQAAMERAAKNEPVTESATQAPQADRDRLDYARKYLRKLVQLDVNLPTLTGEQATQLLLDRAASIAARNALSLSQRAITFMFLSFRWGRAQLVRLLKWGIPLALIAGFSFQVILTLKAIDGEKEKNARALRAQVTGVRKELESVRAYENWLRRMSDPKASETKEPIKPRPDTEAVLLYKAQADVIQLSVKALEQALPLLEQQAETGNAPSFQKLMDSRVKAVRAAVKNYTDPIQLDGRKWEDIKAGMQPPQQLVVTSIPGNLNPNPSNLENVPPGPTGSEEIESTTAWWPVAVGLFPVLALLLWAWRANNQYTIQPTAEYETAVSFWQEQLLKDPDTATPRELKRFMNLSRYAVARLRPQGSEVEEKPAISEKRIVEFTAKWLLARAASGPVDLRRMLVQPFPVPKEQSVEESKHPHPGMPEGWTQASSDDADLFLRVVGDLGSGVPEVQPQPAT